MGVNSPRDVRRYEALASLDIGRQLADLDQQAVVSDRPRLVVLPQIAGVRLTLADRL